MARRRMSALGGGFNRSTQHLLYCHEEVCMGEKARVWFSAIGAARASTSGLLYSAWEYLGRREVGEEAMKGAHRVASVIGNDDAQGARRWLLAPCRWLVVRTLIALGLEGERCCY